jgi:acyl-coenzyme A thioesterase 13
MSPKPMATEVDISGITGNAPDDLKRLVARPEVLLRIQKRTFAHDIFDRVVATEASILPKAEEPSKMEARVVYETVVERGKHVARPFNRVVDRWWF